jgi:hypothetical protein
VVLVKPWTSESEDIWITVIIHFGGVARGPGHPWHLIYQYPFDDFWFLLAYFHLLAPTEEYAYSASQSLLDKPAICRDLCPFCWDFDLFHLFTPNTPRWNIYRGQQREITVPGIYWDFFSDDPPPGFQWDGS